MADELSQKIDAMKETLGPEYAALIGGLQDDQLGAEFMSAVASLDRLCGKSRNPKAAARRVIDGTELMCSLFENCNPKSLHHSQSPSGFEPWCVGDLVATPNPTDRSVVAADCDSAAVASITAIPGMVVVAVPVTVVPHSHTANGGIDNNLCGSGNNRRGDSDRSNRQQTKQNSAHGTTFL
jgi:hypothetical protein